MPGGARDRSLPALLPAPKHTRRQPGTFALAGDLPIVLEASANDGDFAAANALRQGIREGCGLRLQIEGHARCDGLGRRIELRRRSERGDAYRLSVTPERVLLSGAGPAGLRYAVETLLQLIDARARIPACDVDDAPDLERRGIMLDVSRGKIPTATTLRGLVDLCVRLKLNVLMLYVEHTFRFRRHPEIGRDASPLTADGLRELDAYAAARHVELIPSLQSLGHMDHILALPAYAPLAESARRWTISPAEPGTYDLLADLYDEFLPNFRSPWFNANCDEPFDLAQGKSAEREAALGPGGVYLEHVRRVRDLARGHGKRTLIWGDVAHAHPERIAELDRDLVLLDWWYEAQHDYERVARFAENGSDFLVCPGTSSWNCLFPRIENSLENITRYVDSGKRHGALGAIVTDWGDFGHYNLQGNSWFGYAWTAQQAWSGDTEPRAFDRAFSRLLFGDGSGEAARLYRELGAVHDAGFAIFNGSAIQLLYFDDLDTAFFIEGASPAALRRSRRRLERVRARIAAARPRFRREVTTWNELLLAADASLHAVRKAQAGGAYVAWRRNPATLTAPRRRTLAHELTALADEQAALLSQLRRLWLRRSHASEFEMTARRIRRSVRSLRRAARALVRDRPPAAPPAHPGMSPRVVLEALQASLNAARP
jgi:hypothetical protein